MVKKKKRLSIDEYVNGILDGDIVTLSRAITLVESSLPDDKALSQQIIEQVLPYTGNSIRVGITGVPGVGKSTFIEALGMQITEKGEKLAVLAIDPTSKKTQGSIMGDKTRMELLAHNLLAYIRPSASGDVLGGVANKTHEAMLLCEAAGFKVIFIETVGVGQSEIAVKDMVDFFLLLILAGAGDELQGIKKGIMEMANGIIITKADGDNIKAAKLAKAVYQNALHLFPLPESGWSPKVMSCSSLDKSGLSDVWQMIISHHSHLKETEFFDSFRKSQNINWMHQLIEEKLKQEFYQNKAVRSKMKELAKKAGDATISPSQGASDVLKAYYDQFN